jgi:L-fucose isomerase-like protein
MNKLTIALMPIARTTFDIELAKTNTSIVRANLENADLDIIGPDELITDLARAQSFREGLRSENPDLIVVFQATFADSSMVMSIMDEVDAPVLFWAVPEEHTGGRLRLNSFCGINLAGHALTREGYQYEHIFARPDDSSAIEKICTLAKAGRTRNYLKNARLGRVGENPAGFETCLMDEDKIKDLFGLEVVQFDLSEDVFNATRKIDPARIDQIRKSLNTRVSGLNELEPDATSSSLGVYATLQQIANRQEINGFAVRCWPEFFTELGCAACGAMSMMSDELIPCSCEADVNGTITQMILQTISGEPAFGTDMVSVDDEKDALVVWHCGLAPLSMADPEEQPGVTIHSNRKFPLLFEFSLKPGPVTMARLSEATGEYQLVIGRGKMIRGPKSFSGTSGLIQFDRPVKEVVDVVMEQGLEHHISITYGNHADALIAFAQYLDIPVIQLNT